MIDQPSKCLGRGDKEQKNKEGGKGGDWGLWDLFYSTYVVSASQNTCDNQYFFCFYWLLIFIMLQNHTSVKSNKN